MPERPAAAARGGRGALQVAGAALERVAASERSVVVLYHTEYVVVLYMYTKSRARSKALLETPSRAP